MLKQMLKIVIKPGLPLLKERDKRVRLKKLILTPLLFFFLFSNSFAQKQKIAVFAPLYLDSAFDANNTYRYDKNFPKFINPGLEFYEGVQLALDSLNKEKQQLEVFIYDTRSQTNLLDQLNQLDTSVGLIIAHATAQESWAIADVARLRMIPYINVNLPNDGGIVNNPFFVMLSPTLKTHVEGVYRFLQKYFSLYPVVVFRKKGSMEDVIKAYLDDYGRSTVAGQLKLKYADLADSFTVQQLLPLLDSNRQNACIAGSLDDNFNRRLITQLAAAGKSYKISVVGMPTFGNLEKDLAKNEFKGPEIIYGDPFYNPRTNKVSLEIINYFNTKFYARPSDMVMRGYETAWRFSKLMIKYKKDLAANLSAKEFNVFRDYDIQPAINKKTNLLDYYENKKLYFIRWQDGAIRAVN